MSTKYSVFFRVDSSSVIGSGHVIRCLSLADYCLSHGFDVYFIISDLPGNLYSLISQNYITFKLPTSNDFLSFFTFDYSSYVQLPPQLQCLDARQTYESIQHLLFSTNAYLILDHYSLAKPWESAFLSFGSSCPLKIIVIDDLSNRDHFCHILLDSNSILPFKTSSIYTSLVPKDCKLLIGSRYSLLSSSYKELSASKKVPSLKRRVLVYFGGTDPFDITYKTLIILVLSKFSAFTFDVVIGIQSHSYSKICSLVSDCPNISIHSFVPSLSSLIYSSDFAIGSVGTTSWERICLQLPTLAISLSDNQFALADQLSSFQLIDYIGYAPNISDTQLSSRIDDFLFKSEPNPIPYGVVDGFGCTRLISSFCGPSSPITLRSANLLDEFLLFSWANEPTTRNNSLSTKPITLKEHSTWFENVLHDPFRLLLICEDSSSCPIGQIRFDVSSCGTSAYFSFSLDPSVRGFKLSRRILDLSLNYIRKTFKSLLFVRAQVKITNIASSQCFSRFGFSRESISSDNIENWIFYF